MGGNGNEIRLSVVLPVYNERENLETLHGELVTTLDKLGQAYEIVYVDDGSQDGSTQKLIKIAESEPETVRAVILRRNFGQTAAISAGVDRARGDVIVLMDADLQNDPADIPRLLAKLDEGYDLVSGWRKNRKDRWLTRRLPSIVANWLISMVTGVHLHDYGCTLKAYRAEILKDVQLYGEMHRLIPVLARSEGARITEIVVNHRPRRFGRSKYGLWRTFKVLMDLTTVAFLTSYVTRPMYVFGAVGSLSILLSVATLALMFYRKLTMGESLIQTPLPTLAVMFFIVGVQFLLMGLITELVMRTYYESQGKRTYRIRRIVDGDR